MAVAAANEIDVDVARAFVRERFEELFDQREREVFVDEQHLAVDRRFENEERATGEIDDDARECFVERHVRRAEAADAALVAEGGGEGFAEDEAGDRKSTRLNSSHSQISYAGFGLKKIT